ncbi:MAG: adenine deaminase [Bacteroidota bacterium]
METFKLSGQIVDVVKRRIYGGVITISEGVIHSITEDPAVEGPYILPGFIDAHIHIESSMLIPSEFARIAVVHGTVATVSDPHEIANVLGLDGVRFMIDNGKKVPFKFNFGAPSCVPATTFETAGAAFGLAETEALLQQEEILYLSEMMNFPGVLGKDSEVLGKIALAKKYGKKIDGHAPGLKGNDAKMYAESGISTDHECFTIEEAFDKIAAGMHILIREGSAARNFEELIPLLKQFPEKVMFCSDDKHPDELIRGHINELVARALSLSYDFFDVLRACTLNPISHYGLKVGLLQEGDPADCILIRTLKDLKPFATFINGIKVAEDGRSLINSVSTNLPNNFVAQAVNIKQLEIPYTGHKLRVQIAHDGQLVTTSSFEEPYVKEGYCQSDTNRDILKMMVLNRYSDAVPALGFIQNFGMKRGAIGSTVAHDSHNIIAIGTNDKDLLVAVNSLIKEKGGIVCVEGDDIRLLQLPVAGIMSDRKAEDVGSEYAAISASVKALGSTLNAPFMTLSFMSLLVIPALKLSDKGLFNGNKFALISLYDE